MLHLSKTGHYLELPRKTKTRNKRNREGERERETSPKLSIDSAVF